MDYVFFVYGLAFVLLAAICVTVRQGEPRSLPWTWLGLFGLSHGIREWMEVLVIPMGTGVPFEIVRLIVLALSFVFLLEFSRQGWIRVCGWGPGRWIHIPLLLGALAGGWAGLAGFNATVRYALGFPAAAWGAVTLLRAAPGKGKAAVGLVLGAFAFAGYALAAGAIVPAAPFAPASMLNDATFLAYTGGYIQIVRAVLAVLISASLWAYHLQRRRDLLNAEVSTETFHGFQMSMVLTLVLGVGWIMTHEVGNHADEDIRDGILSYTRVAAALLDPDMIVSRTTTPSESALPRSLALEHELAEVIAANPMFRWVHVLTWDEHSRQVSIVASFPSYGSGTNSLREALYRQPPRGVFEAFAGQAKLVGPYRDESGTFISGFAPVRDRITGQVVGVLALDLDSHQWRRDVAEFRLASIAVIFLIALLLIVFFVVRQRTWESSERIAVNEARLAEAQSIAHLGSWTYDPLTERMTWSDEMFHILGYDSRLVSPSYAEHLNSVEPQDREALNSAIEKTLLTGQGYEQEVRVLGKNGHLRCVISKAQPRRGAGGAVVQLVGTMQDITERKQAEERLQQEHTLLRTLIDQMPDCIYVKDTQSRFLVANSAVAHIMRTKSPEDLLNKTDADFYPPNLAEQFRRDEEQVCRTGQALINKDEPHVDSDGQIHAILTTKLPMRDPHGQIVGLIGISRDITERKRAEEEIQRLNTALEARVQTRTVELTAAYAELESFSYSVSHDLRAPLRHVIGFLTLLRQSLHDQIDATASGFLADCEREAARMAVLIDDLLTFSRTTRAELHQNQVDLAQLLKSVLTQFEPDTVGRQIDWKIGFLPEVHGDSIMLRQILVNLVDNAIKFTRPRKLAEIEIGCRSEPGEWVIFVRDNGVGFDPAYADKLFGVFQRLHPRTQFEGTGVGLANVRRIVQRHGGRTWAESEEGCGATFFFSLPRREENPTAPVPGGA